MGRRRVAGDTEAAPASGGLYNIIRYDHVGDRGKQVGSRVSREAAEKYVAEHAACEAAAFEIVKARD